jgi:hypothetical protein
MVDKLKQLEDFPAVRLDIVKIAGEADTFRLRVEIIECCSRFMSKRK